MLQNTLDPRPLASMSRPPLDGVDALVPWLRLTMNTVLPALAIGIAVLFSSGVLKNEAFADIISAFLAWDGF